MYIFKTKLNVKNILNFKEHPIAKRMLEDLEQACESFRGTPIVMPNFEEYRSVDVTGERTPFETANNRNLMRLRTFFVRYVLYEEKRDLIELQNAIWASCNSFNWAHPAHTLGLFLNKDVSEFRVDLIAAETAHSLAEIISIIGDKLDPFLKKVAVRRIMDRVILPFESNDTEKYALWWENVLENWAAVCGGAVGMAALYLIEDEERLNRILDRCISSVNKYIESCTDEGICLEGFGYWTYAMSFYVAFDELLKERTGRSAVLNPEKLKKLSEFPSATCLDGKYGISFSDSKNPVRFYVAANTKLCENYGTEMVSEAYIETGVSKSDYNILTRSFAWFNPAVFDKKSMPGNRFFEKAQWCKCYSGENVLAIKGGHNDEPHNHNDVGSFMFLKEKTVFLDDLGSAKYTRDYFDDKFRYNYLKAGSQGHTLPIINGCFQHYGKEFKADFFRQTDNGAEVSFAKAYKKEAGVQKLLRTACLKDGGLVIKDEFVFSAAENTVTERIVTRCKAEISDGCVSLTAENGKQAKIITNDKCRIKINEEQDVRLIDFEFEIKGEAFNCSFTVN